MKRLPCSDEQLREIVQQYGTPFHLYDEEGIRKNVRELYDAFSWQPEFREYFAVKANTNPYLLEILHEEGCGSDCSSMAELVLAEAVGWQEEDIIFSSNNTPYNEYAAAKELGVIVNVDDLSHWKPLLEGGLLPKTLCFRYNPGELGYGNTIIGLPAEAKYGMTKEQIFTAVRLAEEAGVHRIGLHTMVVSNELSIASLTATATMMFELAVEVRRECDVKIDFIDLGGGIGIPYHPEEISVDYALYAAGVRKEYESILVPAGLGKIKLALECGRAITGPYGWLVTKAIHYKDTYKNYIGVDACMADLMRPALYDAYHHITVFGKGREPADRCYDVVGSLCENNDKFARDRALPEIELGDILVLHDTGAHGYVMGFNYNGKLKARELLLRADGTVVQIRRAETLEDYFATLDYPGLPR